MAEIHDRSERVLVPDLFFATHGKALLHEAPRNPSDAQRDALLDFGVNARGLLASSSRFGLVITAVPRDPAATVAAATEAAGKVSEALALAENDPSDPELKGLVRGAQKEQACVPNAHDDGATAELCIIRTDSLLAGMRQAAVDAVEERRPPRLRSRASAPTRRRASCSSRPPTKWRTSPSRTT